MTLSEFLKGKQEIEASLKSKGIQPEEYADVLDLLDRYSNMNVDLSNMRNRQFEEDAYFLAQEIKAISGKNLEKIAAFLRRFAEHVVQHTCRPDNVPDTVDYIPLMIEEKDR